LNNAREMVQFDIARANMLEAWRDLVSASGRDRGELIGELTSTQIVMAQMLMQAQMLVQQIQHVGNEQNKPVPLPRKAASPCCRSP
jgi:hypothetical protein